MKRKVIGICLTLAIIATMVAAFAGCTKRENKLRIMSPGEYMSDEICREFEAW